MRGKPLAAENVHALHVFRCGLPPKRLPDAIYTNPNIVYHRFAQIPELFFEYHGLDAQ
jgi:hypothetical protein